jgi:hypothetical protein
MTRVGCGEWVIRDIESFVVFGDEEAQQKINAEMVFSSPFFIKYLRFEP